MLVPEDMSGGWFSKALESVDEEMCIRDSPYREQKRNADEQLMVAGTNAFFPARNYT